MGDYLVHSKGKWKKHKYVRKEGNQYIYPEDLVKEGKNAIKNISDSVYNAAGGKYKKSAKGFRKMADREMRESRKHYGSAASQRQLAYQYRRKEGVSDSVRALRNSAAAHLEAQRTTASNAKFYNKQAREETKKYKKSLAGKYDTARKEAGKAIKNAPRNIGRKIDNTKIYTRVKDYKLDESPNEELIYRTKKPYRVKNLRRDVAKSAKTARKNATRSIKRGRNYIKKKLRR